jgi:flagellar basal-body rod modification protein FlgD
MANTFIPSGNGQFGGVSSAYPTGATATKQRNDELGKTEFLQLLITQLKNQDPENAMDPQQFAMQLAQFTQVEKLISIDQKIGNQNSSMSSIAGYLGQQVVMDGKEVTVEGGQGGQLQLNLAQDAASVEVQLLSKTGEVVGEISLGALEAGKQLVSLEQLTVPDGVYGIKVSALDRRSGSAFEPTALSSGLVTGFIPGPDPKLMVGGREVSISKVREVTLPPTPAGK